MKNLTTNTSPTLSFKILPSAESLPLPAYQSSGAAGFDLTAALGDEIFILNPGEHKLVPTGLIMEIPAGFEGQVRPRSGLAAKHGVTVLNTPGTIDSDYRGEVKVILINHGPEPFEIRHGDRIAQMVIHAVTQVHFAVTENVSETTRGTGGFGSTGIKT